jgi:HEPN domain-containing protein
MRSQDIAASMLEQAALRLVTIKTSIEMGGYAYAVRSAQECVEMSLKAALRTVGIEYPKKHDVGAVLLQVRARFPDWFATEEFAEVSRELAEKRAPSMYGDDLRMIPATQLFTREDAERAAVQAKKVHEACTRLRDESSVTTR